MKLTADTITDEQIRGLAPTVPWDPMFNVVLDATRADDVCIRHVELGWRRKEARARCAEILTAREAEDDAAAETHEQDMIDASNNFDDGGVQ